MTRRMCCSQAATLGVLGDPIVRRALVVLRGARYDARFLPASTSGVPEALDGMQLMLLGPTPGLSAARRKTLVASLVDTAVVAGTPILELVVSSGRAREEEGQVGEGGCEVPWPCSFEELERCIEDALCAAHRTYRGARRHSPAGNEQACS
jgi:hypothetical protein